MIGRVVTSTLRSQQLALSTRISGMSRGFSTTSPILNTATATPLPVRRPVGAFRGGVFGFLFGSVAAGASVYYYILKEYRVSNEMLTDDIYVLQATSQKLSGYITELETKIDDLEKKKKK